MNNILNTVFLDVDGVLADWDTAVNRWYGIERLPSTQWDIDYEGDFNMTGREFWNGLTEQFWRTIPLYPWAKKLVKELEKKHNVVFLSAVGMPQAAAGRLIWIKKHFNSLYFDKRYLVGPAKQYCARGNAILVDDKDDNVEKFVAAGGHGLIFPQSWNSGREAWEYGIDVLDFVTFQIEWINAGGIICEPSLLT